MSITVGNAIKNRASNEEILTILKEVPNPNQEDDDGVFHLHFFVRVFLVVDSKRGKVLRLL